MQTLHIGRLILNVSGLTEEEAHHVALKVSEGLAAADIPRIAIENPGAIRLDLRPVAKGETNSDSLVEHIVCNIVQELSRLV